jgi:hypothetical protein
LRRVCGGEFKLIADMQQMRWTPDTVADVRQARAFCAESAVQFALVGTAISVADGASVLWVDPVRLDRLERVTQADAGAGPSADAAAGAAYCAVPGPGNAADSIRAPRWRAEPGVTVAALARAGLAQFAGIASASPELTLAAWFADRRIAAWPPGRGDLSGVLAADVLLADGVVDTLGPFGAEDGQPLRTASLQTLVPALFRLSSGAGAQWCRAQSDWPARYRLDALLAQPPVTVNLAQMLHGHEGTLVWLEGLILQSAAGVAGMADKGHPGNNANPGDTANPGDIADARNASHEGKAAAPMDAPLMAQARALDARVKDCFDPSGLFPELLCK